MSTVTCTPTSANSWAINSAEETMPGMTSAATIVKDVTPFSAKMRLASSLLATVWATSSG